MTKPGNYKTALKKAKDYFYKNYKSEAKLDFEAFLFCVLANITMELFENKEQLMDPIVRSLADTKDTIWDPFYTWLEIFIREGADGKKTKKTCKRSNKKSP